MWGGHLCITLMIIPGSGDQFTTFLYCVTVVTLSNYYCSLLSVIFLFFFSRQWQKIHNCGSPSPSVWRVCTHCISFSKEQHSIEREKNNIGATDKHPIPFTSMPSVSIPGRCFHTKEPNACVHEKEEDLNGCLLINNENSLTL